MPPSPPPVVDPDVVLSLEHVQFDGALNLMYSSKQELAGFQFVVRIDAINGFPKAHSDDVISDISRVSQNLGFV